jgi:Cdc6-like AAA superfamily ATPase
MEKFIQDFIEQAKSATRTTNRLLFVKGTYGVGKSFLTKTVLDKVQVNNPIKYKHD